MTTSSPPISHRRWLAQDDVAMRKLTDWERAFVQERKVARLTTVSADGRPAVTPICYAVVEHDSEPVVVSALDEKPKSVSPERLARVRNIQVNPKIALVVDDYNEDW